MRFCKIGLYFLFLQIYFDFQFLIKIPLLFFLSFFFLVLFFSIRRREREPGAETAALHTSLHALLPSPPSVHSCPARLQPCCLSFPLGHGNVETQTFLLHRTLECRDTIGDSEIASDDVAIERKKEVVTKKIYKK